jgi:vitamin B12 transporter
MLSEEESLMMLLFRKHILFCIGCLVASVSFAQKDSVRLLEEVKLYHNFSAKLNSGYMVQVLSDSIVNAQQLSLGTLLQYRANLYFKQNGNGMVSSIALRGSSTSQTSVFWNGIAINSSLNGQVDFNTLSANSFNQIEIRKGGGSVLFGSGAIGGAINLRDQIIFIKKTALQANIGVASYNTQKVVVVGEKSNESFFAKIAVEGVRSNNDFPYLETSLRNENGAYRNHYIKGVLGYQLNANNQLHFFANYGANDRDLSRTLTAPSNANLENFDSRFMLAWKNFGTNYTSSLNVAYLKEKYHYFPDKSVTDFSFGETENILVKYDFKRFLRKNISFHVGFEDRLIYGRGTNINKENRNSLEGYFLMNHQPIERLTYNLSIRKGTSTAFKVPFIYALDVRYNLPKNIGIRANYSTNYRLPTFNDLYWNPGGNLDLLAEQSRGGELGIDFSATNFTAALSSYITDSENLIQWRPNTTGLWQPVNVQNVRSYGAELELGIKKRIHKHHFFLESAYAYTISKDQNLEKQLIYVPKHKLNNTFSYRYKSWSLVWNQQYTSEAFTTTSNTQSVDPFWMANTTISKAFTKYKVNIGLHVHNLFNTKYETVAFRPMPGRNIELNINFKI